MPSQTRNGALLFIKCANLNTDPCLYGKSPEMVLSLFSDPENFVIDDQGVQELNDRCSQCNSYQIS